MTEAGRRHSILNLSAPLATLFPEVALRYVKKKQKQKHFQQLIYL